MRIVEPVGSVGQGRSNVTKRSQYAPRVPLTNDIVYIHMSDRNLGLTPNNLVHF